MSSTAVAAQNAFIELLQNADTLADAHVTFGGTAKLPKTFELVWVMPVRRYRRAPGEQFDIETFDLVARFEVFRTGEDSGADTDTRRWELIDATDAELKRKDFHGYRTKGSGLEVLQEALDLYDKGWVAVSEVAFGVENWLGA